MGNNLHLDLTAHAAPACLYCRPRTPHWRRSRGTASCPSSRRRTCSARSPRRWGSGAPAGQCAAGAGRVCKRGARPTGPTGTAGQQTHSHAGASFLTSRRPPSLPLPPLPRCGRRRTTRPSLRRSSPARRTSCWRAESTSCRRSKRRRVRRRRRRRARQPAQRSGSASGRQLSRHLQRVAGAALQHSRARRQRQRQRRLASRRRPAWRRG